MLPIVRQPIVVALNATRQTVLPRNVFCTSNGGCNRARPHECTWDQSARASLADATGSEWAFAATTGLGIVGAGCDYDPAAVVSLLTSQDQHGGSRLQGQAEYAHGLLTTIMPGQTVSATMTFVSKSYRGTNKPTSIQISCELVIGAGQAGAAGSYSLRTLVFDRVSLN